jgi:tRNA dimethylallyltransferase
MPGPAGEEPSVPIVAVVGATASGKTGLSLDLAERLGGEIVNTDAMQVYRGMDIGTAKLPEAEWRGIPHHLLDTQTIRDTATVAQFQGWARTACTDEDVRRELEAELDRIGPLRLHRRLAGQDPEAAARIIPENGRRVVRALEVIAVTGRPYSASLPVLEYADPRTVQIGVDIDRPTLDARIEARVDRMFELGFVDEVARLLDEGLAEGVTAPRAIGYREVTAHLAGELTLDEAHRRTTAATRRFARRQDGWFRKDPRIVWVDHDDPDRVEKALTAVEAIRFVGPR